MQHSTAWRPISAIGTPTVDSGGSRKRAIGMSSKPATAMSLRHAQAGFAQRLKAPIAIMSLAANIASGRPAASSARAALMPGRFAEIALEDLLGATPRAASAAR